MIWFFYPSQPLDWLPCPCLILKENWQLIGCVPNQQARSEWSSSEVKKSGGITESICSKSTKNQNRDLRCLIISCACMFLATIIRTAFPNFVTRTNKNLNIGFFFLMPITYEINENTHLQLFHQNSTFNYPGQVIFQS
jgi:hypothetical protein